MNYIGSKHKLIPFLCDTIKSVAGERLDDKVFCDIFAGTGIVGRHFKTSVKKVISNDLEYYSYILNRNYIGNHLPIDNLSTYIDQLNQVELLESGFIYNNYCLGGGGGRQYFSDYNGRKIDTIRTEIERWYHSGYIGEDIYFFLLCSLLESADKLANTASVYGAFLKRLKKTATNDLILKSALFDINTNSHEVYNRDANSLIKHIEGDILYLDPPYNARQYGANYHLLNTIAEYKEFQPKGKTGLREYSKSRYCTKKSVYQDFEELIERANFKYLFLSYNNEGLMSTDDIRGIMERFGHYDLVQREYQDLEQIR